jgi:hypothetical protein
MSPYQKSEIPARYETLMVLHHLGRGEPFMMLPGDGDGYGTRWTLGGQQVQPAIAQFLMRHAFVRDAGLTELGAHQLRLTPAGRSFHDKGRQWWDGLGFYDKLKVIILG